MRENTNIPETYVPTRDAAKFLGLSDSCLERLRWKGGGPRHYKLGKNGRIRYKYSDLIEWAEDNNFAYGRSA
ncbi:helix-turn-helix domain-containing protein [Hyphobacterium sp. CCMP332]|uniref:helix-turn-helix transcriptional regulator n=1 Tax=Hyphobacterium sp. CCMP332 TaxID=2749086 RepID=UPI00164F508E|nr:helix-turn-helix domain-containing protein [Hyphobacterium sp. CCMP332]QNL19959.1 helix-turn-helix domain-containing protein [Hyphobacterium sp. CCMP332]